MKWRRNNKMEIEGRNDKMKMEGRNDKMEMEGRKLQDKNGRKKMT